MCYNLFASSSVGSLVFLGAQEAAATDWRTRIRQWAGDAAHMFEKPESLLEALDSFSCDVWTVPDGTVLQPGSPCARVEGPPSQVVAVSSLLCGLFGRRSSEASTVSQTVAMFPDVPLVYAGDDPVAAYVGGATLTTGVVCPDGMSRIPVERPDPSALLRDRRTVLQTLLNSLMGGVLLFADDLEALRSAGHGGIALKKAGRSLSGVWSGARLTEAEVSDYREILVACGLGDVPVYQKACSYDEAIGLRGEKLGVILESDGRRTVSFSYHAGGVMESESYWDSRPWTPSVPGGRVQLRRSGAHDVIYDESIGLIESDQVEVELLGSTVPIPIPDPGQGTDLLVQLLTTGRSTRFPEPISEARARRDAQFVEHRTLVRDHNSAAMDRSSHRP